MGELADPWRDTQRAARRHGARRRLARTRRGSMTSLARGHELTSERGRPADECAVPHRAGRTNAHNGRGLRA